ncbi:MAG: ABC transporter permease [Oligoflexales bacterium]|nr:ABC transporter permease [Oligoflexales bacterium]
MNALQVLGACELGLIYGLVALGVYISFRVIDFPDLTVDGSFPLGAAVTASLLVQGCSPVLSFIVALFAGLLAGAVTAYLSVRWNILGLLASILTMTALYSINLRIMGQQPNIALINEPTLFQDYSVLNVLFVLTVVTVLLLKMFFSSDFGLAMRASGINPKAGSAYGVSSGKVKFIALSMSNGLVAAAGALFTQSQGFADISMGTGTIVIGLASVIIGESVFHPRSLGLALFACVIGSVLYRLVISLALNASEIGLQASDLNLLTAALVATATILAKWMKKKQKKERVRA